MKLYIASTDGYSGKTLMALALGRAWTASGVSVGYVKPLGKVPVLEEGRVVDGDAAFLARELGLGGPPEAVCPVVITQDLLVAAYRGEEAGLAGRVSRAIRDAAARHDVLLVGGAANLRDGILLGLSPLDVVREHRCRVLLVDRFEGEKSVDQVLWAAGELGDRLLGVVLNRVDPGRSAFARDVLAGFYARRGIRLFGTVPADPSLESVSAAALAESLGAEVACGADRLDASIERFCVGAMDAESALRIFRRIRRKAVVTGGGRADVQAAALETDTRCLVLTGGVSPPPRIAYRAEEAGIPVLVCPGDTLEVVERVEDLLGRLRIRGREKADRGARLVAEHLDLPGILEALRAADPQFP